MKILVTGGFGFIGSHLVERVAEDRRASVSVVDDLSSSPLPLGQLLREFGALVKRLDRYLCTVEDYCAHHADEPVDAIYHLASVVGPAGVLPHTGKIVRSIVDDTYAVVELALRHRARLVVVSTSEVYGGGVEGLCAEDMPKIVSPRSSARLEYAIGKLAAETVVINTCQASSLQACIVRPFNVAGPRQSGKGGFVLPRFVGRALKGLPLEVFGDGSQLRAFTHVRDIVSGLLLAMERGQPGEVYNLGNPTNRCSIGELAEAVIRATASSSTILFVDPKKIFGPLYEEASDKFPDASKAMSRLGWQPITSLDETVRDVTRYFDTLDEVLHTSLGALPEPAMTATDTQTARVSH